MQMHKDLWERIRKGIEAKGRNKFGVEKVKGHAKEEDVHGDEELEEKKRRNDEADTLAVKRAHMRTVDPVVRAMQKHEEARVKDIQEMMIDVAKARYKQITSWGLEGLDKKLQEAEESGTLEGGQEGKIEEEEEVWYVMNGSGAVRVGGEQTEMKMGDAIAVRLGEELSFANEGKGDFELMAIGIGKSP